MIWEPALLIGTRWAWCGRRSISAVRSFAGRVAGYRLRGGGGGEALFTREGGSGVGTSLGQAFPGGLGGQSWSLGQSPHPHHEAQRQGAKWGLTVPAPRLLEWPPGHSPHPWPPWPWQTGVLALGVGVEGLGPGWSWAEAQGSRHFRPGSYPAADDSPASLAASTNALQLYFSPSARPGALEGRDRDGEPGGLRGARTERNAGVCGRQARTAGC